MRVTGIDHVQLEVADVARSAAFYTSVLGMEEWVAEGSERVFLRAGRDILTLVRTDKPVGSRATHFGFLAATPEEVEAWRHRLGSRGVAIDEVAVGEGGSSIYFRDPDGYRIEIFHVA